MVKHKTRGASLSRITTVGTDDLYQDQAPSHPPLQQIPRGSVRQKIAIFEQHQKFVDDNWKPEDELYDLTPVAKARTPRQTTPPSYSIDPFEFSGVDEEEEEQPLSPE